MIKGRYTLTISLHGEPERIGKHWAFSPKEFGWTLYSETQEGLAKRLSDAVRLFVGGFPETPTGLKAIKAYLEKHNIEHSLTVEHITSMEGFPNPKLQFSEWGAITSGKKGELQASRTGELVYA